MGFISLIMGSNVIFRYDWPIKPQNLGSWLVKSINLWLPDCYWIRSYLITYYCKLSKIVKFWLSSLVFFHQTHINSKDDSVMKLGEKHLLVTFVKISVKRFTSINQSFKSWMDSNVRVTPCNHVDESIPINHSI